MVLLAAHPCAGTAAEMDGELDAGEARDGRVDHVDRDVLRVVERLAIVDAAGAAVSSTAGTFLPANWIYECTVTPGQRVSAISNDAGTFSLSITELTD